MNVAVSEILKQFINEDKKEHETYYSSSEFLCCQLTGVEWRECFGDNLIFEGNTLMHSAFKDCEMPGVIMKDNMFYSTYFNNCDIKALSIIGMRYADLEFHFTEKSKDISMHSYNRIVKKSDGVLNKTFVQMMEGLGYDIELTYVKREEK